MFSTVNKSGIVKGVVISASSASGKTFLLKRVAKDSAFVNTCVFEMDSLKYGRIKSLTYNLPLFEEAFYQWCASQEKSELLTELVENIERSSNRERLIKFKFIELMLQPQQFITVLPQILRHVKSGIQFLQLLERYFQVRLIHIAIIPSTLRYIVNLFYRKKLSNYRYLETVFGERAKLISKKEHFDGAYEVPVFFNKDEIISMLKRKLCL